MEELQSLMRILTITSVFFEASLVRKELAAAALVALDPIALFEVLGQLAVVH